MKLTRRDLMWKWLAYGLSLALVTVINYCVLNQLPLGAIPVLLPVTAVAVGVLEGPKSGAGYGMAAGIVMAAATHGSMAWVFLLCDAGQVLPRLVSGAAGLPVLLRVAGLEYLWTAAFAIPVYGLYHLCCQKCGRIYHE